MIVVSTDIVAALYLPGENTATAEAVLTRDPAWASPMLWRTVFPHYVTEPLRSGAVTPLLVGEMLAEAEKLFLSREFPAPVKENMQFVFQSQCSAFMAPFLGLAKGAALIRISPKSFPLQGTYAPGDAWPRHLALTPPEERNAESLLPAVAHVSPRTSRTTTSRPHKQMFRKE